MIAITFVENIKFKSILFACNENLSLEDFCLSYTVTNICGLSYSLTKKVLVSHLCICAQCLWLKDESIEKSHICLPKAYATAELSARYVVLDKSPITKP